jgi:hypothetical protein
MPLPISEYKQHDHPKERSLLGAGGQRHQLVLGVEVGGGGDELVVRGAERAFA